MNTEQMQKIVDGAPEWATTYCTAYAAYSATFHWYGSCKNCYEVHALRTELAKHDTLDLEPADIPHGTIVLEK